MRAAVLLPLLLAACTDPKAARDAAEASGFSDVETTGYEPFGCSENDEVHTGFRATNARGQRVAGVVCSQISPFGKASTVRIYATVPDQGSAR